MKPVYYTLFCFLIVFPFRLSAQKHPIQDIHESLTTGIEAIFTQNYSAAEEIFKSLVKKHPKNPLGNIYLAATYFTQTHDLGQSFNTALIENQLDEADHKADALLEMEPHNSWYLYYKALAHGYRAYFESESGSWFSAFKRAISAKNCFTDCVANDSTMIDCYVAIGAWKFWSSDKTEFIRWMPFVSDERKEGIQLLQQVIRYNTYNRNLAIHSLFWIYVRQKRFREALYLVEPLYKRHPQSRFFLWDVARANEEIDRKLAIQYYQKLLDSYSKTQCSKAVFFAIYYIIAKNYFLAGEATTAREYMNKMPANLQFSKEESDYLGGKVERMKKLKSDLGLNNAK
ncbi:MAG: hypothetical protein LWX56_00530 [Ignavibacteria bacterium]|nr:hypothetical protein [Ignavibacteria bacterium]